MKVHQPGYLYELENFEHPDKEGQVIQFIEKVPQAGSYQWRTGLD